MVKSSHEKTKVRATPDRKKKGKTEVDIDSIRGQNSRQSVSHASGNAGQAALEQLVNHELEAPRAVGLVSMCLGAVEKLYPFSWDTSKNPRHAKNTRLTLVL